MLSILKDKWALVIVIIGILLRLLLMPTTLHPDLWGHSFTAYFFAYKGVLNIYDYLLSLPSSHPLVANFGVSDVFIYPPLTYFTLGIFRLIIRPLVDPQFIPWVWNNMGEIYERGDLYWNIFLYKLPYLFIDIFSAIILANLFDSKNRKRLALSFWIFNPITLYTTFMIGQIDLLPTFFLLLSLFFWKKEKRMTSIIMLGIGGSYKMYPLLFILPAAFLASDNLIKRIKYIVAGFIPFIATILPFIGSSAFRSMVLFSPKSQKMLFMGLNVSGAEVLYVFIVILTVIYLISYYKVKDINFEKCCLVILLLTFSITHYHPQWFLWITPFYIIELLSNKFKYWEIFLTGLVCWLIITLLFEPSLSYALFNPINPKLNNYVGLSELLGRFTNVFQLKSLVRSVFAGTSIFYVFKVLKFNIDEK